MSWRRSIRTVRSMPPIKASSTLLTAQIAAAVARADEYERARERADALAEIDRAKTAFFSNVSHEFRTPLTLMLGPLEDALAAAEPVSSAQRERLEIAHRNALRLLRLVNSLLDFSRIEAGRVEASYLPTDLAALTADLASHVPIGYRQGRPAPDSRCAGARPAGLCRSGNVGEDCPQPGFQRLQVHLRRGDRA